MYYQCNKQGSGKTTLAKKLARVWKCEIINGEYHKRITGQHLIYLLIPNWEKQLARLPVVAGEGGQPTVVPRVSCLPISEATERGPVGTRLGVLHYKV